MIPGLETAEFARYGSIHRNTFIDSPSLLDFSLQIKDREGIFFAGQITGVEGYIESAAMGLLAGLNSRTAWKERSCPRREGNGNRGRCFTTSRNRGKRISSP